jgi:hypothetical protein
MVSPPGKVKPHVLVTKRSDVLSYLALRLLRKSQARLVNVRISARDPQHPDIRSWSALQTARPMLFNISVYVRVRPNVSQMPVVSLHSTMSRLARALRIDLTFEVEHCVICSTELGQGHGKASLVYVLKDCRCVSSSLSIWCTFTNNWQVICGLCVQFPSAAPFLPCQHADHLGLGWQRPLRLYNLKCAICLDTDTSTRVSLVCGKFTPSIAVLADSQGHVYCQTCILCWARSNSCKYETGVECPTCRNNGTKLWRLLLSDQVVTPAQRGVEIISPDDSP